MTKIIKIFLVSLTCLTSSVFAQKGTVLDKIIAKVNDKIVLKSELDQSYLQLLRSGQISSENGYCQVLESMIVNKMMIVKAHKDSVDVSEQEIEANLEQRIQYFLAEFGGEDAFEAYYKKTIDEFKDELRDKIADQLRADRMQSQITSEVSVTPLEVKHFFNSIPKDSVPFFSAEVTVAQIVKIPVISRTQKDKVRKRLKEIREKIVSGEESFESMAKEYSEEPIAKRSGGNLGFHKRGEMVPRFEAAALRLKPGQISKPIETDFGFHIIELLEKRGNQYNSRHILLGIDPSQLDWGQASNYLDSIRTVILQDSIAFEKVVKEHSDDKYTASSGGYLKDDTGANQVSVDDIEASLFFILDTMEIGSISKPIKFTMRDGKEALRIIFYESRIPPHAPSLEQDYQKIQFAALNEKKNKKLSEWFIQSRENIYIDIDPEYDNCEILR